ncbi:cytochrome b561 and DOMON domain-containing protein At5g35735 [Oryza sativa Japonica Group]|jgi:hypothetical protein|uniref:Membrane protein, putative, expressed n=4 Tax=Oryza TaxID=4527 RepID=Q8H7W6_ORYSJ|nr:cytochrome b561 and DOMON domain-containing protein At5g35735 [Oryza sativa Japonica Group]XP_052149577.1 cytochrome b561 and DOMON domain-containing protein At5g35735-like [Oryza glaberrima]KAB8090618.1 hypothetical protein EE612_015855 [Oryza sativa]AAN59774.1 Unknown protein [Oryza sativa Japonica Group]ABF94439.1 membrane protein, putative, expressed [Oryza sativa Japonica Group]KAF2937768.1 hypothetical protein DAI22_03g073100 [Oryza sativa Japonica Group]BAF11167.1 Os03g0194600 [Oryz|eukprot:NP_001049253.1 Os03g0194600 [Oryza sativa Japonica Group]
MARLGRSAWLLAAAVLLYAAAAQPDCANATFQAGRTYRRCDTLPVLGASLHWTYHPANGTADVAFRAPQSSSGGWVAWGINTQGAGMVGSSVFIASQINATGAGAGGVSVVTTVLESFSPSLRNGTLRFDVPAPPAAEYSAGAYTIYATVALPGNSTTQNMVWQAGPVRGGAIAMHPTTGANLRSTKKHDFTS